MGRTLEWHGLRHSDVHQAIDDHVNGAGPGWAHAKSTGSSQTRAHKNLQNITDRQLLNWLATAAVANPSSAKLGQNCQLPPIVPEPAKHRAASDIGGGASPDWRGVLLTSATKSTDPKASVSSALTVCIFQATMNHFKYDSWTEEEKGRIN